MKEKVNLIYNYLLEMENKPIGTSDYCLLIEKVNQEEKIIDNETMQKYRYNLLNFLDSGLVALLNNKENKLNIYDSIVKVLTTWENLPNKWEIKGYDFKKLFEKNIFESGEK